MTIANDSEVKLSTDKKKLISTHDYHFGHEKALLIFRICCLVYFITECFLFLLQDENLLMNLCAQTNWGQISTTLYFFFVVADYSLKLELEGFLRLFNFLVFAVEFLISIFFWSCLFPQFIKDWSTMSGYTRFSQCSPHSMPMLALLFETAWNKHLFIIKHWWVPVLFNAIYACVNAIYTQVCNRPIYPPFFTWRNWWTPLFALVALGLTLGGVFIVFHGKNGWHRKMTKRDRKNNYEKISVL